MTRAKVPFTISYRSVHILYLESQGLRDSSPQAVLHFVSVKKKSASAGLRRKESVGDRIRQLRKARGVTQNELGRVVGLSRRMIAYYETQGGSPSAELLVKLANALDVSMEVLVGRQKVSRRAAESKPDDVRLWRRLKRVRELPAHDRKTVLKIIDTMADRASKRKGG